MNKTYNSDTPVYRGDRIHLDFHGSASNECRLDTQPGQSDRRAANATAPANTAVRHARAPLDSSNAAAKLVHHPDPMVITEHHLATLSATPHFLPDHDLQVAANEHFDFIKTRFGKFLGRSAARNASLAAGFSMLLLAGFLVLNHAPEQVADISAPQTIPAPAGQEQANLPAPGLTADQLAIQDSIQAPHQPTALAPSIVTPAPVGSNENTLYYKEVFADLLNTFTLDRLEKNAPMIYSMARASAKSPSLLTHVTGYSSGIKKSALDLKVSPTEFEFQAPETTKVKSFLTDAEILRSLDSDIIKEFSADATM